MSRLTEKIQNFRNVSSTPVQQRKTPDSIKYNQANREFFCIILTECNDGAAIGRHIFKRHLNRRETRESGTCHETCVGERT